MTIKVSRRLIALALTLLLCITSLPVFAATYSGGPKDCELDRSLLLEAKNVSIEGNTLVFSAGGSAKFDLLVNFDTNKLMLKYEAPAKDVKFAVAVDKNSYEVVLEKETTEKTIDIMEEDGSHVVSFKADNALSLKGINFHKVNEGYPDQNKNIAPFSTYEDAMLSLVALKGDVGVVKSLNNLMRWDYENIYLTPKNINGSIYAPAKKLAEVLSLYCEDYPELSYLYMLDEFSSLSLKKGKGFYEHTKDGKKDVTVDVIYEGGIAWVPVRKIAETFGFTVDYKDGYVLIGDRLRIKKVFEDSALFGNLKDEFNTYKVTDKKPQGKTYHVAQTKYASDANSGTKDNPFLTIGKAAEVAKAGDTVIVHEGTYRETVKPKNNGTALAPITFKAADGERVVISALEKVSNFIDYKGEIYCATAPIDLGFGRNQLFYKGEQLIEGRHPNEDTKPGQHPHPPEVPKGLYATKGNIRITEDRGNKAHSTTDLYQEEVDYWKGGTFVTLKGQGWSLVSGEILGSDYGEITVTDHAGSISYNLGILPSVIHGTHYYYDQALETDYGYITNHINTLDLPGEWFMKDNVMFVIPPKDADLKNDFEIKQRQLCIDLRNRMYVTFDGIDTIGGSMTAQDATGCTFLNGEFKNVAHHTILLDQNNYTMQAGMDHTLLESQKNGETGFYVGGKYNAFVNCVLDRSSGMGIGLRGKYHYVTNCIVSNCSYSGGYPGNIDVRGDKEALKNGGIEGGHFVTYNTLYNAGRGVYNAGAGASMSDGSYYGSAPTEMAYNRCFNGSLVTRDTGVTYEYGYVPGNDVRKTQMHHNFVYDLGHWDTLEGTKCFLLYHDGFTSSRDTYSNVVWYDDANIPVVAGKGVLVHQEIYGIIRARNNSDLSHVPEGEAGIERSDYPGTRVFVPGADHDEYTKKNMANYEAHDAGVLYNRPVEVKKNAEAGTETFKFKNVDFETGGALLNYYTSRKAGATSEVNVTAKLYDKSGKLVFKAENPNTINANRYYLNEVYKGVVIFTRIEKGTYDVELEISDDTLDVHYIMPKFFNVKYDNLYTKEDEAAGIKAYNPASVSIDEETGTETFSFKDVQINGETKTLFKVQGTRENNKPNLVDIVTNVYNKEGKLVFTKSMPNTLTNKHTQKYEVLTATTAIPEIESGTYDIDFVFGDTFSEIVRIIPEVAPSMYDNLFNRPDVFTGGSWDDYIYGEGSSMALSKSMTFSEDRIQKFNYNPGGDCWSHTVFYRDREVIEGGKLLRVTQSSGSGYSGSVVKLYLDSTDSEPIAEWTVPDSTWAAKTRYIELKNPIKPGKYTFIFDFEGAGLCSTLWNFTFCNEEWDMDQVK